MFEFINPWTGELLDAYIEQSQYVKPTRLYLGLRTREYGEEYFEPYCDITVNLPGEMISGENCAFVDTNNAPFITEFLEKNGLAEPTGLFGFSGWCAYPEYRFDLEKISKNLPKEI